jgi:hypothetical protein
VVFLVVVLNSWKNCLLLREVFVPNGSFVVLVAVFTVLFSAWNCHVRLLKTEEEKYCV